jgi:hypothetical protein
MENNFLKALCEKRPDYNVRVEKFQHPSDIKGSYITLYVNDTPTRIVLDESELNSDNTNSINELTDIVIDYVEKYNITHE